MPRLWVGPWPKDCLCVRIHIVWQSINAAVSMPKHSVHDLFKRELPIC